MGIQNQRSGSDIVLCAAFPLFQSLSLSHSLCPVNVAVKQTLITKAACSVLKYGVSPYLTSVSLTLTLMRPQPFSARGTFTASICLYLRKCNEIKRSFVCHKRKMFLCVIVNSFFLIYHDNITLIFNSLFIIY